ncbi:n5-methyltetrahydromethanopterin:coenzyme m methyltransferase subunit b [hydrocarbon metagenome]|uniref:tetrahydromethanopterin S-methyltransferase n=1 Tax=hydrocarbon metagenome TaxID=938273 RepID=A0A0W8FJ30_9ZZZZ|nr:tetrahydromethanopterin S-methyltransferase subunit B [Methanomicrobiaceae archaeon]
MGFVIALPEYGLVIDPMVGILTSAGESLAPVLERMGELEKITDDLIGMLSAEGNFLASFPNREGVLKVAGSVTAFWYGMAIGLFVAGIVVFGLL